LIHVDDGTDTDTVVTLTRGVRIAEALSLHTWQTELTDAEREELSSLLPGGLGASEDVVQALFDRREYLRFGRDDVQRVEDVLFDVSAALDPLVVQFARAESERSRRVYDALIERNQRRAVRDALQRRDPASLSDDERATLEFVALAVDDDLAAPPFAADAAEPPVLPLAADRVLEAPLLSERVLAVLQDAIDYATQPDAAPFEWTESQVLADRARNERSIVALADEAAAAVYASSQRVPVMAGAAAASVAAKRRREQAQQQAQADADFTVANSGTNNNATASGGDDDAAHDAADAPKKRPKPGRAPYVESVVFPTLLFIRDLFFADVSRPVTTADVVQHVASSAEVLREKPAALPLTAYVQLALQMMAGVTMASDDSKKRRSKRRSGTTDGDEGADGGGGGGGGVGGGGDGAGGDGGGDDDMLKGVPAGGFIEARGDGVWQWVGPVPPADDAKAQGALDYRLQVAGQLFAFVASRRALADALPNSEMHISRLAAVSALGDGRVVRNAFTLPHLTAEAIAVVHQQEYLRYAVAPATFAFANDQHLTLSSPIPPPDGKARHHALLRADRPANVTLQSVVADALARMPGGVSSRADLVVQVLASPYFERGDRTDADLIPMLSGALERLRTAADPMVRFAPEHALWVYLWRARALPPDTVTLANATPEQLAAAQTLQERALAGAAAATTAASAPVNE
jgi:uncharacterized membrane protein YgcG